MDPGLFLAFSRGVTIALFHPYVPSSDGYHFEHKFYFVKHFFIVSSNGLAPIYFFQLLRLVIRYI
mgnify:CR=1 FL=1